MKLDGGDDKLAYGKLIEFTLFSSSSAAADFILGYGASGPHTWKTKNGRLLRELGQ